MAARWPVCQATSEVRKLAHRMPTIGLDFILPVAHSGTTTMKATDSSMGHTEKMSMLERYTRSSCDSQSATELLTESLI